MLVDDSENFPRGGTRPTREPIKRKREENLFEIDNPRKSAKKSNKKRKTTSETSVEDNFQQSLNLEGTLSFKNIKEGLTVLGCIQNISNFTLYIEFPGLVAGKVSITRISDSFTRSLSDKLETALDDDLPLKKCFTIGQILPVKIIELNNGINGSVNPRDINSDKTHHSFKKGMFIWACIQSELDHGYELNLGVENCRVFLPLKNVDPNEKYLIGEVLFCVIHRSVETSTTNTLTVSAKRADLNQVTPIDWSLNDLTPGVKVEFFVEEKTTKGIKGRFLDNYFGYIDQSQLFSRQKLEKIREASTLNAHVLFVEPITKVTYLTLRGLENVPDPDLEIGDVLEAIVSFPAPGGLFLTLNNNQRGFVSNKRLLNTNKKTNPDVKELRVKYPEGSKHTCRILHYNRMEELYICTFETDFLREDFFTPNDLTPGQLVKVEIRKIVPNGLVANVGRVEGFIPNSHLTSSQFSQPIKGKFTPGNVCKSRVLTVSPNGKVIFTLKKGLIESDNCLISHKQAVAGSQFVGFIAQATSQGALVVFYNNVRGWISEEDLNEENPTNGRVDPRDYFFIGQVVNVWILENSGDQLRLSIHSPPVQPLNSVEKITTPCEPKNQGSKIQVGDYFAGKVLIRRKKSLQVQIRKGVVATLPMNHLSNDLNLCPALLATFKPGDEIEGLMCVKKGENLILSRREGFAFKQQNLRVRKFDQLKVGMNLRCSFEKYREKGGAFFVTTPLKDFHKPILVLGENKFENQQSVLAKIKEISKDEKKLILTTKFAVKNDKMLEGAFNLLESYVKDWDFISGRVFKKKSALLELKPGTRVMGVVETISEQNCTLKLPMGVKGVLSTFCKTTKLKIGDEIKLIVLHQDFANNLVDVYLAKKCGNRINAEQNVTMKNLTINSSAYVDILLKKDKFLLGVLRGSNCNGKLIYLPLYFNENDQIGMEGFYKKQAKVKVFIYRIVNNKVLGIQKSIVQLLNNKKVVKQSNKQNKNEGIIKHESDTEETDEEINCLDGSIDRQVKTHKQNMISNNEDNLEETEKLVEVESGSEEEVIDLDNDFANEVKLKEQDIPRRNNKITILENKIIRHRDDFREEAQKVDELEAAEEKGTDNNEDEKVMDSEEVEEEEEKNEVDSEEEEEKNGVDSEEDEKKAEEEEEEDDDEEDEEVNMEEKEFESEEEKEEEDVVESAGEEDQENYSEDEVDDSEEIEQNHFKKEQTGRKMKKSGSSIMPSMDLLFSQEDDEKPQHSDEEQIEVPLKKRKLTPSERVELAKKEEERIVRIEQELLQCRDNPRTADQFDRLLLALPDSSEMWMKYIAMHISNAEFDKARAVGKRALETINMTETKEKFNIWIALLNLENMYGTKESFDNLFQDAVKYNDSLEIYLSVIDLLAESGKLNEMEEKIKKIRAKEKQNMKMWTAIGQCYYRIGKFKEARNLRAAALKSIQEKKRQFDLILKFAVMEFNFGELDQAIANFETILDTFPNKVTIWSIYVDQLVKKNNIDLARKVLERAVSLKLPAKSMKSLFQKFVAFEEKHGTTENVQEVKRLARKFVKSLL